MTPIIVGNSVRGASHIQHNTERQDSFIVIDGKKHIIDGVFGNERYRSAAGKYYAELSDEIQIVAVADGHGSASCPYSKTGSQTAANVFCDLMAEFAAKYKDHMDKLFVTLSSEGEVNRIAKRIIIEWEKRIFDVHRMNKRDIVYDENNKVIEYAIWKQYGTTLLGMLITSKFIFAFQLGDGDINYVDENGVSPVIEGDKILGVETHSISKQSSWKKVLTKIISIENKVDKSCMYILSTDGFVNSHSSEEEFHKTCKDYLAMIQQYGAETVDKNIPAWLSETSEQGCGDDITVLCVYYGET